MSSMKTSCQLFYLFTVFSSIVLIAFSVPEQHLSVKANSDSTNLLRASIDGDLEVVKSLLKADFNPEHLLMQNEKGFTALMLASFKGHVEVAKLLLKKDSSPKHLLVQNGEGWNALMLACWQQHLEIVELLLKANSSNEHLLAKRTSTLFNTMGWELIWRADPTLQHLLAAHDGCWIALTWASYNRHFEVVELLLKYNSTPEHLLAKGVKGQASLMGARGDDIESSLKEAQSKLHLESHE